MTNLELESDGPSAAVPAWASCPSPWGVPWRQLIDHRQWYTRFPAAPPPLIASELTLRALRRRPEDVPRVLWDPANGELPFSSALARLASEPPEALHTRLRAVDGAAVQAALEGSCSDRFAEDERAFERRASTLLSPAADAHRSQLFEAARRATRARFDGHVQLFAPLYLSSFCHNRCSYCHFSLDNEIVRVALSEEDTLREAHAIAERGINDILLLTGEAARVYDVSRIARSVELVRGVVPKVRVEVHPLSSAEYTTLRSAGACGVTLYQETYDPSSYRELHRAGRKRDYLWRLGTLERAAAAGLLELGLGPLLGLGDFRHDTLAVVLHAHALERSYPELRLSLSFPRIRSGPNGFVPRQLVTDLELEHALAAARLLLPDVQLVLSTRESPALRDHLVPRYVTRLSAGSVTRPGGYSRPALEVAEQFPTQDQRTPHEIRAALQNEDLRWT